MFSLSAFRVGAGVRRPVPAVSCPEPSNFTRTLAPLFPTPPLQGLHRRAPRGPEPGPASGPGHMTVLLFGRLFGAGHKVRPSLAKDRSRTMPSGPLVTRLDRYVFRQLFLALIAVTGGLAALIWLTQSLRFVELVVNHGLSLACSWS